MHIFCDFFIIKIFSWYHFMTSYFDLLWYNLLQRGGTKLRTLYIDVYFLINFTVDILSLYFSSVFSKTPTSSKRLIFSSLVGSLVAVIYLFLSEAIIIKLSVAIVGLIIMGYIGSNPMSLKRKVKFIFSFIIFSALIGGAVNFIWGVLDKYAKTILSQANSGIVNRKTLLLSIILLLSIGVFKMIITFFSSNESQGTVEVEICFQSKKWN